MFLGALVALVVLTTVNRPTPEELNVPPETAPFEAVHARLLRAKGAVVSPACGSAMWPWAYRGSRGARWTLRPYSRQTEGAKWARRFTETLLRPSAWDFVMKFKGLDKSCDEGAEVPLFSVTWKGTDPELYAILSLETRCAQVFEANRPLGTVWFADRADTVFALVREALAGDPRIASLTMPAPDTTLLGARDTAFVEELPEVVDKTPPSYPEKAIQRNVQGTVVVQALVTTDGQVGDAFVRRSVPLLDDAALDAMWQWRFRPARASGKPVAVWVAVPVKFTLR